MSGTDNRVTSGGINVFDIAQEVARAIAEAEAAATANDSQTRQNNSAPIVSANATAFAERTGTTSDYARQFFQNRFALQTSDMPQALPKANNVGDGSENNVPLTGPVTLYATGAGDSNQIDLNDISQGNIGDCYLMSAMGAVARSHPEVIQNMITENRDGDGNVTSYTVTFHENDNGFLGIPGLFGQSHDKEVKITVDATFPSDGKHANASSDTDADGKSEIWPLIIEKAYAQYKGGYSDIGGGGDPANTLSAITGRDTRSVSPGDYSFETLQKDLSDGRAIVYDTKDLDRGFFERTFDGIFNRTPRDEHPFGLYGDHAYMVTGAYTDADGQQMVTLRNPWGYNDPKPIPYAQAQQYSDGIRIN